MNFSFKNIFFKLNQKNSKCFTLFPTLLKNHSSFSFINRRSQFSTDNTDPNKRVQEVENIQRSTPSKNPMFNRYNFTEEMIENCSVKDLIEIARILIETENKNFETWFNVLNKFNSLICEHCVSKSECIEFVQILNHIQPKGLEKKLPPKNSHIGTINLLSKKHEEEYFKARKPRDILVGFTLFLKQNLKANVIRNLIEETVKFRNQDGLNTDIEDIINSYNILFDNIELKVIDDIRNGRADYTVPDCINLVQSFSRAEEGTNMLYEILMRKVAHHTKDLTLSQIEILMNY